MAYDLETPIVEPPTNKGMLEQWALNRITLGVVYSMVTGYYKENETNALGNPLFVAKTPSDVVGTVLNDPAVLACMTTALAEHAKELKNALTAFEQQGKTQESIATTVIAVFNKLDDIFQSTLEAHYINHVLPEREKFDQTLQPHT